MEVTQEAMQRVEAIMAARPCDGCSECCHVATLYEVGFAKPAMQRCRHQCPAGCAVYQVRPRECAELACAWKLGMAGGDRPDIMGVLVWVGAAADHSSSLVRVEIDLARAGPAEVAFAWRSADELARPGQEVWMRVRGRDYSFVIREGALTSGAIGVAPVLPPSTPQDVVEQHGRRVRGRAIKLIKRLRGMASAGLVQSLQRWPVVADFDVLGADPGGAPGSATADPDPAPRMDADAGHG